VAANFIYAFLAGKGNFWIHLSELNFIYIVLALILTFIPWLTHAARVYFWGKSMRIDFRFSQAFRTVLANDVGGAVVPVAAGGGYAKLGFLMAYRFSASEATLITMIGTIEDALFFAISLPLAIAFSQSWDNVYLVRLLKQLNSTWPIFLLIIGISVALYYVAKALKNLYLTKYSFDGNKKSVKLLTAISNYKQDLKSAFGLMIKSRKRLFFVNVMLAGAGWISRYSIVALLIAAFGFHINPLLAFVLQWLVFSASSLIPTPGGVVAAEFSFAVIFNSFVPSSAMPILVGIWRFITFYLIVITGAIWLAFTKSNFIDMTGSRNQTSKVENVKA
jgi:uncharacterized protein (TIRG00374 family)